MRRDVTRVLAFLLFMACILMPQVLHAQASCSLEIDRDEATLDDVLRLRVKCEGKIDGEPSQIAGLQDFTVGSSGTSTQIQFINGSMSKVTEYTYLLQPRKTGTFTIGPANVTSEGKTVMCNTVTLKISGQEKSPSSTATQGKPVFLKANLSTEQAYPDQQLTYTLKFYYRERISDVSIAEIPESKDISLLQQGKQKEYRSHVDGLEYQVIELRYSLIAPKSGTYRIDPARMRMTIYDQTGRRQSGPFNDPFFTMAQGRPISISSEAFTLHVKPLPATGRPSGFTGLIGSFQMNASLSPAQIKTGETATLIVQVRGDGNIKNIPDLSLPDISGLKAYADQPQLESNFGSDGISGSKTMKWALVAQYPGEYAIPPLQMAWFDPREKRYITGETSQLSLTVLSGGQAQTPALSGNLTENQTPSQPIKKEVTLLGKDILPVHTSLKALEPGFCITRHPLLLFIVVALPPLIFVITILLVRKRQAGLQETPAAKARRALKHSQAMLRQNNLNSGALLDAFRLYINMRFNLTMGLITPAEVNHVLMENKVSEELITQSVAIIKELQQSVYTGQSDKPDEVHRTALIKLIQAIDKEAA